VHVLPAADARGPPSGVPRGLPRRRAQVRQRARPAERDRLRTKRVFVLKEDVGTLPRFFYYFDERYPRTDAVPDVTDLPGPGR